MSGDNTYRFPDPTIFIPAANANSQQISTYFITWLNYFDDICLAQSSAQHKRLSSSQWRELLLMAFKEARLTFKPNSGAEARHMEINKLLDRWVAQSQVRHTPKSRTTTSLGGKTLTLDSLPSVTIARSVVFHLCELNFRSDLRALDAFMHVSPNAQRKDNREELLSSCFPEWVKGVSGGDFISIGDSDAFTGLAAPTIQERGEYVLQLAKVMSTWCGVPASISGPALAKLPFIDFERLESDCAVFFAQ